MLNRTRKQPFDLWDVDGDDIHCSTKGYSSILYYVPLALLPLTLDTSSSKQDTKLRLALLAVAHRFETATFAKCDEQSSQ